METAERSHATPLILDDEGRAEVRAALEELTAEIERLIADDIETRAVMTLAEEVGDKGVRLRAVKPKTPVREVPCRTCGGGPNLGPRRKWRCRRCSEPAQITEAMTTPEPTEAPALEAVDVVDLAVVRDLVAGPCAMNPGKLVSAYQARTGVRVTLGAMRGALRRLGYAFVQSGRSKRDR